MNFNLNDLPPEKKRVLAIGGIAFVALLFLSFLISLTEDDGQEQAVQNQQVTNNQNNSLQLPSSQRYDFENNQHQGQNFEQLLNKPQPIGEKNDPFANMGGSRGEIQVPGPAPIPTDEDQNALPQVVPSTPSEPSPSVSKEYNLHCNSYANKGEAEQRKAMLAFQGVVATIESYEGKYRLKIGPYQDKEKAQEAFNNLSASGLLEQCRLIGSNK